MKEMMQKGSFCKSFEESCISAVCVLHYFRKIPDSFTSKASYLSVVDSRYEIKIRVQAPLQRGSAPEGGPGFDYPQRGFSLPAFNDLRSGGVMEEIPFFIALRERIPKENLKV